MKIMAQLQATIPGLGFEPFVPVEPPPAECTGCGELKRVVNLHEPMAGMSLCEDCYSADWCECNSCGDSVEIDHSYTSEGGDGPYCEACYDDVYTRCDSCNCEVSHDDTMHSLCQNCYWDTYTTCDDCDCELHRDDTFVNDDGCFCEGCYSRHDREGDVEGTSFIFLANDTFVRTGSLRTFGVELETSKCDGYMDLDGETYFDSKDDGSINGKEFVSRVLRGDRGLEAISEFCGYAAGFSVDNKCGFHLHIGCQDLTVDELKAVCAGYALTAKIWQSFVVASRRSNGYCRNLKWDCDTLRDIEDFTDFAESEDRYQWLNVAAYAEHSTLEVRLHTGTLNGDKVCNWVKAHIKFVDYISKMSYWSVRALFEGKTDSEVFDLLATIWNDSELTDYYRERARKYGTDYRAATAA